MRTSLVDGKPSARGPDRAQPDADKPWMGDTGVAWHPYDGLTPQQESVVKLLCRGLELKEIAHELNLGESTIKSYVMAARKRMNCRTSCQLVAEYLRHE